MAVRPAFTDLSEIKIPIERLTYACFIVFFASSFLIFNVYAQQQGGAATGGNAVGGSTLSGPANCYGTCNFYGGPATGGTATGGNAIGSGSGVAQGGQPQLNNNYNRPPHIDGTATDGNAVSPGNHCEPPQFNDYINNNIHPTINTDNINCLEDFAGYYLIHEKYAEAIPYLDKALAINPNDGAALIDKGNAFNGLGRYNESITYYDKVLAMNPNSGLAQLGKDHSIKKLKKHDNG